MNTFLSADKNPDPPPQWIATYGWILTASFVLSQPFGHLFELPMALMAGLGLWLLVARGVWATPAVKALLIMFACIWLPMLFSLTDAVNFSRSAQTTLVFLRFPCAGIFIIYSLQQAVSRNRLLLMTSITASVAALVIVALTLTGHSESGRVTGLGFPIGQIIGALSPILFFAVFQGTKKRLWMWLIFPLASAAIVFTGSRASWIMFAVAFFLFLLQLIPFQKALSSWKSGVAALLLLGIGAGLAVNAPPMKHLVAQTEGLFSGNYEKANAATSLRLPIWTVAIRVAKDHWINGIGPRGFRYVYPQYVPKNDFWVTSGSVDRSGKTSYLGLGPNHPHQFFLEVATETGGIGLLGYLFAFLYLGRLTMQAVRNKTQEALPWMAAVFVAIMPINSHMAFYASFWSCLLWWLVAVALGYWQAGQKST